MKTSIETTNGKLCTVVWHDVYQEDHSSADIIEENIMFIEGADVPAFLAFEQYVYATILPALPKHPKPEHAPLLYRYMAEGIIPTAEVDHIALEVESRVAIEVIDFLVKNPPSAPEVNIKITHATDETGQRVEIAITEDTDA